MANRDVMWDSIYCKACRVGKDMETFCTENYNNNKEQCLKYKVADSVCVSTGALTSLAEGLQVDIDPSNNCFMELGLENADEISNALQEGTLDRKELDRCWSNVVGEQSNFGEDQWALGSYFARTKKELGKMLDDVFNTIETATGLVRRRVSPDGYSSNKVGNSNLFNTMNPNSEYYIGSPLETCDTWLKTRGSGLENPGQPCAIACNGVDGYCSYCGTGKCCKDGVQSGSCSGAEGGDDRYVCVPDYTQN